MGTNKVYETGFHSRGVMGTGNISLQLSIAQARFSVNRFPYGRKEKMDRK